MEEAWDHKDLCDEDEHVGDFGFYNPHRKHLLRRLHYLLMWQLGYYKDEMVSAAAPADFAYPNPKVPVDSAEPRVTWINHSTALIQVDGVNILTDPVWGERVSPLSFFGPKREHPVPLELEQLPPIHVVLISHNHYDHLDKKTVRWLAKHNPNIQWCVPLGVKRWLGRHGIKRVLELDWGDSASLYGLEEMLRGMEVHATPAQHYSGRGLFDYNKSLWCGWVIKARRHDGSTKVAYFVGDTGYNAHDFKAVGKKFNQIDLSLVPIGVYRPYRFMQTVHVNPEDAVEIHRESGSKLSVGIHHSTFHLSSEPRSQPPYDLYTAMMETRTPLDTFRVLEPGQTLNW